MTTAVDAELGRRRFLGLMGTAAATFLIGGAVGGCSDVGDAAVPTSTRPTADAATRRIGERYLAATPGEHDEAVLRAGLSPAIADADPGGQRAAVDRAVRADFEAGRLVELDGWLLSENECRLAALTVV